MTSQRQAGLERDILNVVGVFLGVHGVAEGWILAFGSPLACIFWLWLGSLGDAALQPARTIAKRRLAVARRPYDGQEKLKTKVESRNANQIRNWKKELHRLKN